MIFENRPKGTKVWNPEYGFGELVSKSPKYKEDGCMIVRFGDWGDIYVPRKNLTEIEEENA